MIVALIVTAFVLFILITAAYRWEIPQAVKPLVIVYFLYLGYSLFTQYTPSPDTPDINKIKSVPDSKSNIEKSPERITIPVIPESPRPLILDSIPLNKPKSVNSVEENIKSESEPNSKPKPEKLITKEPNRTLILKEMLICRGIYKRSPIKPGKEFSNRIDSLYCYTKISNSGSKQELKHIWYYNNREMTRVLYNVKPSFNYRSWSKKMIYPENIGEWRVDVMDEDENILGSRSFIIAVSSSEF